MRKISKHQLDDMIQLKYGISWLILLAGNASKAIYCKQCDCTEEEFIKYREFANINLAHINGA